MGVSFDQSKTSANPADIPFFQLLQAGALPLKLLGCQESMVFPCWFFLWDIGCLPHQFSSQDDWTERIRIWLPRPMNIYVKETYVWWENMRKTHGLPMSPVAHLVLPILDVVYNHPMMDLISRHPRPAAILEVTPWPSRKVTADRRRHCYWAPM